MHPKFATAFAQAIYVKVELLRTDVMEYEVSEAAWEAAQDLGIDLRTTDWTEQTKFDPKRERFHLEHVVTVKGVVDACLAARSESEVAAILGAVRVAWILKEENRVLDQLGVTSARPDPDAAYRAAGITLKRFDEPR